MAAVLASGLLSFGARAIADPVCSQTDPATGQCLIWVQAPGSPGNPGNPGDDGPKDTGSGAACFWDGPARGIALIAVAAVATGATLPAAGTEAISAATPITHCRPASPPRCSARDAPSARHSLCPVGHPARLSGTSDIKKSALCKRLPKLAAAGF